MKGITFKPFLRLFVGLIAVNLVSCQEIVTPCGKIMGATVDAGGKKVNKFLGVPYAEPPIGPLRFRVPKEKAPWADTFDATKPNPPMCIQINAAGLMSASGKGKEAEGFDAKKELGDVKAVGGALAMGFEYEGLKDSEDCLTLNIFAPADGTADSKRPVMMWIHGGAFFVGGATIPTFDGSVLAAMGDVVVVVPQFRLGVLGFLHGATAEIPGNMGLRDQAEAMKWIKKNIAPFGGNGDLITVFGQNSGGWSTGFHLLSPLSQPLFKRAIMQSGSSLCPLMLFGESAARNRFEKFLNAAAKDIPGCAITKSTDKKKPFATPGEAQYKCLSELTMDQINKAQTSVLSSKKDSGFLPSEDNTKDICFFCANPFDVVKNGKFGDKLEILFGTNSNEGGMFLSTGLYDIYPPLRGDPKPVTLNDLVEHAKKKGAGSNAGQMQMMLPMFFRGVNKKDPVAVRKRLLQLVADMLFVCPDQLLINGFTKAKGIAWYYRFDYRPSTSYWAKWLEGAQHTDEVQLVFGHPHRADLKDKYTDKDRLISTTMMKIWSEYARTGKPNIEKKWKWKPCKGKDRNYLLIGQKKIKGTKSFPKNSCKDLTRYYSMGRSFLKNYKA